MARPPSERSRRRRPLGPRRRAGRAQTLAGGSPFSCPRGEGRIDPSCATSAGCRPGSPLCGKCMRPASQPASGWTWPPSPTRSTRSSAAATRSGYQRPRPPGFEGLPCRTPTCSRPWNARAACSRLTSGPSFPTRSGRPIWNRPGHDASLSINQRMGPHWAVGAAAEALINGSAEDRVLRNEYSVQPQLEYRFNRSNRLLLYGEYLLKRYPSPLASQNAVDPRVGVRFRQLLGAGRTWGVGGRYDYNRADSTRYHFRGWAVTADVASTLWAGARVSSSVRYRVRGYTSRLVELGTTKVLRRDDDWVATITWGQRLARSWEVVVSYQYETYQSNDSRREFLDHWIGLTFNRWW